MKFISRVILAFFSIIICYSASAQAPNITYSSPQKLYVGKAITPITPSNTGGSVPIGYNPHYVKYISPDSYVPAYRFVVSPSGDVYANYGYQLYHIKTNGETTVLAGANSYGYVDGFGASARFNDIAGMCLDDEGNIYVAEGNAADAANCKIRKVTPQGLVSTVASGLGGIGDIAMGPDGFLYTYNFGGLVKISKTGVVSVVVGPLPPINGTPTDDVREIAIDKSGNIYLVDVRHSAIRKVTGGGVVSIFAGSAWGDVDGLGTNAKLRAISSIAFDSKGVLWINDYDSYKLKKITPDGNVTTVSIGYSYMPVDISLSNRFFITKQDDFVVFSNSSIYKLHPNGYRSDEKLPDGLTCNTDGSITGTPTQLSPAHEYTIRATNDGGTSITTLSIEVVAPADPPLITSFATPTTVVGGELRINGSFFLNATGVTIGGKPALEFGVESSTLIWARVPAGASSGQVSVTTPNGTASLGGLIITPPPVITSLSATSGKAGDKITITGSNLSTTSTVYVGGYTSEHKVISDTELEITLNQWGESGSISLYTSAGSASYPGFTYIHPPTISAFSPTSAPGGATVTITGTNFYNVTAVKFGATAAASFSVESPTTIKAVVAAGSTGQVTVVTPAGTRSAGNFIYISPPAITNVNPLKAAVGSTVNIFGSNLSNAQLTVGGAPATITFNGSSQIAFTVPAGVSSSNIMVTTSAGSISFTNFLIVPPPQIVSFSPASAAAGEHVIINGQNFAEATTVSFGPVNAQFTIVSPTVIDAVVGQGSTTGSVIVTSPGGNASSAGFTYRGAAVTTFAPLSAGNGETVTITGSNFSGATNVTFGGVDAQSFTVVSSTEIKAIVGLGTSGLVAVTTDLGLGYAAGFSHPGPSIINFSPAYAGPLSTAPVVITGKNFTGATSVKFGGVPAASFTINSSTIISAVPAISPSGDIEVTTPLGTVKRSGFSWVQPPVINSFNPSGQKATGAVTINGSNFIGVTGVKFGGVAAQGFFANSAGVITANVGNGASGDVTVTTVGGTVSLPGFKFTTPEISSITPSAAGAGQTVTITGKNLSSIQQITFGGTNAASFTIVSDTEIKAVLGAGALGAVTLTSTSGSANYSGFTYIFPATLYSVEPKQGGTGAEITISGNNLATTSQVTIGGTSVDIISKTESAVKVRAGNETSGTINVQTPVSNLTIEKFEWFPAPVITSISPTATNTKDTVTVYGTNFIGIKSILFGDRFGEYWAVTPTQMKLINIGGGTSTITVNATGGSTTFSGYTFIQPPVIDSYSVIGEGDGAIVAINGSNFYNVASVTFGGVVAKSFTVDNPNKITAIVGAGANGLITVTTPGGNVSRDGFLYKYPPAITAVTPLKGSAGTVVTISGRNFNIQTDKNVVYFGPALAEVVNATKNTLQVKVPEGAGSQIMIIDKDKQLSGYGGLPFYLTKTTPSASFSSKLEIGFDSKGLAYPPRLAIADFDNDGKTDLVIGAADSINIMQYTGSYLSKSGFKKINVSKNRWISSMAVGDIDSDGKTDIVFCHNQSTVVLRNNTLGGAISFETKVFEGLSTGDAMEIRDFDSDGKPDLLIGKQGIYKNTSIGTGISFGTFVTMPAESVGDISGDGRPDLVYASDPSRSGLVWYYNQAINGRFSSQSFLFSTQTFNKYYKFTSSILNDFNGDGTLDILAFGNDNNTNFIKRNITGPFFEEPQLISSSYLGDNINAQDINGDGKPDLIAGKDGGVYAYLNNLQGDNLQFNNGTEVYKGGKDDVFFNYLLNDIDRDGSPDLLMVDYLKSSVIILYKKPDPKPQIADLLPKVAAKDGKVTITGKYFDEATVIKFGSKTAKSFNIVSPHIIEAIVGNGETGIVTVLTPYGTAEYSNFTFLSAPAVKTKQVIIFPAIAAHRYGDPDIEFNATSTNADVVLTYSIDNPEVATIVNNKIHILKAGAVKVTASQEGNDFYEPAENVQQTIVINKAPLVITTDDKTKVAGKPNPAFTVSYSGLVNGETSLILTQQPVVATTATAASGAGVYDIVASGAVAGNYDITYNNGKLTITKDKPVITFPAIVAHRYGDVDIELAATSTNAGVPLTYSTDKPDVATVFNNKIHILKAGSVKVTASQVGNSFYEPAESVQQTFLIDKVALVITADDKTRAGGKPDPSFTVSYQGFVKGETSAALGQPPVITTTATAVSAAGVYNIVPSGAVSDNYNFTYNNGKLTITPALDNLKVSATDVTCKGQANGIIAIVAKQTASYTAVLTGNSINKSFTFTANLNIDNLSPGTYNVCVSDAALPGQKRCFDLAITEPKDLSVYAAVVKNTSLLNISLGGGEQYQVTLNGRLYSTRNNNITLELSKGSNKLEVVTDKECQGKIEQIINYSGNPVPYPNPFGNELFINVGVDAVDTNIKIYNVTDGSLKLSEQFKNVSGVIKLDVNRLKMGIYSVRVTKGSSESVYKVIKQ